MLKKKGRRMVVALVIIIAIPVVSLALTSALARRPDNLGVVDGRLAPCPNRPNCVSTQATEERHVIQPLRYEGDTAAAMQKLQLLLEDKFGAKIVKRTETYIHAEFTSSVFRFVDDVEFVVDRDEKLIHFRSASRVGYSDFGANRRRMEAIRQAFVQE